MHSFMRFVVAVVVVVLLTGSISAQASVVLYDNFGSGNTFDHNMGGAWWIYSDGFGGGNANAVSVAFTPTVSTQIEKVIMPLDLYNNAYNYAVWGIYHDNGSGLPGLAMTQQSTPDLQQGGFTSNENPPLVELVPFASVTVQAGVQYWVVLKLDNAVNTSVRWYETTAGDVTPTAVTFDHGQTWVHATGGHPSPAVQVLGVSSAPEPGSVALLGVMGVMGMSRRRRR